MRSVIVLFLLLIIILIFDTKSGLSQIQPPGKQIKGAKPHKYVSGYVNPFIGSGGNGNIIPMVCVPFGSGLI